MTTENTALATTAPSQLAPYREPSTEEVALIKAQYMPKSTDIELQNYLTVCRHRNLDPFKGQMHPVARWNSDQKKMVWMYQVAIDGLRAIAARTGEYAGSDEPVFDTEEGATPNKCTVTVWRIVQGQRVSYTGVARFKEYVQTKKGGAATHMWAKMPYNQLAKCAEAQALRKGFPEETSGLYEDAEVQAMPASPEDEPGEDTSGDHLKASKPEPKKEEPKAKSKSKSKPAEKVVDAEVVNDKPKCSNEFINGAWKTMIVHPDFAVEDTLDKALGKLKLGQLHTLQKDVADWLLEKDRKGDKEKKEFIDALCASVIQEVEAALKRAMGDSSESPFQKACEKQALTEGKAWRECSLPLMIDVLAFCKTWVKEEQS
jgi:phage recombination protein Bet